MLHWRCTKLSGFTVHALNVCWATVGPKDMPRLIDCLIDGCRGVLGDRSFSKPWGGSVLDSIIGTFLTQNVTDQLSSQAYMTLAATFPAKPYRAQSGGTPKPYPVQSDAIPKPFLTQSSGTAKPHPAQLAGTGKPYIAQPAGTSRPYLAQPPGTATPNPIQSNDTGKPSLAQSAGTARTYLAKQHSAESRAAETALSDALKTDDKTQKATAGAINDDVGSINMGLDNAAANDKRPPRALVETECSVEACAEENADSSAVNWNAVRVAPVSQVSFVLPVSFTTWRHAPCVHVVWKGTLDKVAVDKD